MNKANLDCVFKAHADAALGASALDGSGGLCGSTRDFESLSEGWYHSNAFPYATQRRKQKDDLTDKTLKSAQKPEKNMKIRIEIRWLRKPLKVDGTPGMIVNSMQIESSLAKAPNKLWFYKDLLVQ